jgi:hypothetical protein
MVTAAAILVRKGEELLPSGKVLDSAIIESIRRRAIRFIMVNVPDTRDEEAIRRDVEMAEKRLLHIFRGGGSEARAELQRAITAFRLRQAS